MKLRPRRDMGQPSPRDVLARAAHGYLPPAAIAALRQRRREWLLLPGGWADPLARAARGWNAPGVAAAYAEGFAAFRAAIGPVAPLGVPTEVRPGRALPREDPTSHNVAMTLGYVLARARRGERLSVLDWGGAFGHLALMAEQLLPDTEIDWHCVEVPAVAAAGRRAMPEVSFHDHEDGWRERRFDLVVVETALQYVEDWEPLLARLAAVTHGFVFLGRVPLAADGGAFVALQRPRRYGYETEYAGWVFDRTALLAGARRAGLVLEREFLADEGWLAHGASSRTESRSLLLRQAAPTG